MRQEGKGRCDALPDAVVASICTKRENADARCEFPCPRLRPLLPLPLPFAMSRKQALTAAAARMTTTTTKNSKSNRTLS